MEDYQEKGKDVEGSARRMTTNVPTDEELTRLREQIEAHCGTPNALLVTVDHLCDALQAAWRERDTLRARVSAATSNLADDLAQRQEELEAQLHEAKSTLRRVATAVGCDEGIFEVGEIADATEVVVGRASQTLREVQGRAERAEAENRRMDDLCDQLEVEHDEAQGQVAVLREAVCEALSLPAYGFLVPNSTILRMQETLNSTAPAVEAFVNRIRGEENEACAKLADKQPDCRTLAKAIRARRAGEKGE